MLRTTLSLALLASTATAQITCPGAPQNLIANGGFEDLLFNPWTVTSRAPITYPTESVNGIEAQSRCLSVGDNYFSAVQPAPFRLLGGTTYLFSVDLDVKYRTNISSYVYITPVAGGSRIKVAEAYSPGKLSIVGRFTPNADTDYTIEIAGYNADVDNVRVVASGAPFVHVVSSRYTYAAAQRSAGSANTFRVVGDPSANFALHFGAGGLLPQPISFPFCGGSWLLAPPMLQATVGTLNSSQGTFVFSVTIPAAIAGLRLDWQAAHLSPVCDLGCARAIAFF